MSITVEIKKKGRKIGYKMSQESRLKLAASQKAAWVQRKADAAQVAENQAIEQGYRDHTA